ncbi:uncharacterized protein GLRG_06415 [Colletotrichum graminicola M1.001]|uniref:BTB domain-containing protein n=1 Tax=Colletotrichum graminicola (strain M1.001 / M2 / FGSC 10212) TaxID=645133 RepID=E3QK83_COLGM|nr:uncharacterized protein GLRG_06415 [Colletotrichum graminicola M1.001]EFQ31271.1 hypothetical protein GLRG_06415 [Colletotrichum graminicola M1.001]
MADVVLSNAVVSVQEDWLCDNSEFFRVCLRGGWKETITKAVHLEHVDAQTFLLLVEAMEVVLNSPDIKIRHHFEKASDRVISFLPDSQPITAFSRLVRLADFLLMTNLYFFLRRV